MSVQFLDGPASGTTVGLRRAPNYLRVVIGANGKVDALDLLSDTPREDEKIHVYQLAKARFTLGDDVFVCTDDGQGGSRPAAVADADYCHRPDVDGEQFRETVVWRTWASAQPDLDV